MKSCVLLLLALLIIAPAYSQTVDSLYVLKDGETKQVNALWGENPQNMQFGDGRNKVVIADLKGPGMITMIHFALPQAMKLNRDTTLRIYWDGEVNPSVEAPLVDFFCDPNGALERIDSALVNKKRGWNCYFRMPFAKSAKVELAYDNPRYPNGSWSSNPCYSYVIYRTLKSLPPDAGYFHATWRQEKLLLGKDDYKVFETQGKGQWVGWNMTVRGVGSATAGYPVDENVNFYIDGEKEPSIAWQGLEDSFGFSWGFPEVPNGFPYTGYQPYMNGAAAYRFNVNDCISFKRSLLMTVGFGKNEAAFFRTDFSKPENPLEFSSVAYWYQKEPHTPWAPIPSGVDRRPTSFETATGEHAPGETVVLNCGRANGEIQYLASGWDFELKSGYSYEGWATQVNHCWADYKSLDFDITCPKGSAGTLRLFIIDGDNLMGGREESITVAGKLIGNYKNFQAGQWIEAPILGADTASGRIPVAIKNLKPGGNAVVSLVRFVKT